MLPLSADNGDISGTLVLLFSQPTAVDAANLPRRRLTRHAAAQLRWRPNTETSAVDSHCWRYPPAAIKESESRLNLTERNGWRAAGRSTWRASPCTTRKGCANIPGFIAPCRLRPGIHMTALRAGVALAHAPMALRHSGREGFDEEVQVVLPEAGVKWVRTVAGCAGKDAQVG
jgi:hypothetical protein